MAGLKGGQLAISRMLQEERRQQQVLVLPSESVYEEVLVCQ